MLKMNDLFIHKLKNLFVCISLALVGMLQVNSSLFTHTHINEYGQVIMHAHPFSSSEDIPLPLSKNKHTNSQLYIFASILILFVIFFVSFQLEAKNTKTFNIFEECENYAFSCVQILQKRGPPHI